MDFIERKCMNDVFCKIDFEKAYDKVKWPFVQQALRMEGFDSKWCDRITNLVQFGSVGIRVNDDIGHHFEIFIRERQRDLWSPIHFNIVVDMLVILIAGKTRMVMFEDSFLIFLRERFRSYNMLMTLFLLLSTTLRRLLT